MQSDGNLVIYNEKQAPVRHTSTGDRGESSLTGQNDCNPVIYYSGSDEHTWATNTFGCPRIIGGPGTEWLGPGQVLEAGRQLKSNDGNVFLGMQHDGNLVLYRMRGQTQQIVWSSGSVSNSRIAFTQCDTKALTLEFLDRHFIVCSANEALASFSVVNDSGVDLMRWPLV
eukprot:TRINITY_DN7004_c0_g1_i1.p1 TRINITY_DN7004_c0_g1~~TRINITY_DN7004_c0_g1_i1.p1  ORF type:complete len:189 (+),score=26.80 TRINITY_DN7004_c0_g1_i1:59-568(+)